MKTPQHTHHFSSRILVYYSLYNFFRKKRLLFSLLFSLFVFYDVSASGYIRYSSFLGGNTNEENTTIKLEGEYVYILGTTTSPNYPVTDGSSLLHIADVVLTKLDTSGNVVYSRYLGNSSAAAFTLRPTLAVENGYAYLCWIANSPNYPTTNGSNLDGSTDFLVAKLDPAGNTLFSTYLGGKNSESNPRIAVENAEIYIGGTTNSQDYPNTFAAPTGAVTEAGAFALTKFNTSGNIAYSRVWGGSTTESEPNLAVEFGLAYFAGTTNSLDYPSADAANGPFQTDFVVAKFSSTGNFIYNRRIGGTGNEALARLAVINGAAFVAGFSNSSDYPNIGGLPYRGQGDYVVTKIEPAGLIGFSTYIGGSGSEDAKAFAFTQDADHVYLMGLSSSANYPNTNGSINQGANSFVITKLSLSGNIVFSTYLGGSSNEFNPTIHVRQGYIIAGGTSSSSNYPSTNNSFVSDVDFVATVFSPSGNILYSTALGGMGTEFFPNLIMGDKFAIVGGSTSSVSYPITNNVASSGLLDFSWTLIDFCPVYSGDNKISPDEQMICENSIPEIILGTEIWADPLFMPLLYRQGIPSSQGSIQVRYQWQEADSDTGPWTNIPWGTAKDFLPSQAITDKYFRRLALSSEICGRDTVSISNHSSILLNGYVAPEVDAGGIIITCPMEAVELGATPTASGGAGPFTYEWSFGQFLNDSTFENPKATVGESTIFTLIVTDQNECKSIDQVVVRVIKANAGADKIACAGTPVQIGTLPIAGVAGLSYSWSPTAFLNNPNIAQPLANPENPTIYTLTINIPLAAGGSCDVSDDVLVTPIKGPSDPDFAGKDVVICASDTPAELGSLAEGGYSYTWSPGNYLTSVNVTPTTYNPGINYPNPNPFTYYLTAERAGCIFTDEVKVTTLEARAGRDGCGPRVIGLPDRTPNLNETYFWKLVSGPGSITGLNNTPETTVSASVGGPSTYALEVCLDDVCCSDEVIVPDCGCDLVITVNAPAGCPQYDFGPVTLTATAGSVYVTNPNAFTYQWSPCDGLSSCTGRIVELTDNVPRTYTVTMTSPIDGDFTCSSQISVNDPAWSLPIFNAVHPNICRGDSIQIGQAPIVGYGYQWSGSNGFSSIVASPYVKPSTTSTYVVEVTDILSGCRITDSSTVTVAQSIANAGPDWNICELAIVELGVPDLSPGTYSYAWSPVFAPWQNGTDETSPNPSVLVATSLDFFLTVTDIASGCESRDSVSINVNNNPTLPSLDDIIICPGDEVLIGIPAQPGVVYSWSPPIDLDCITCSETLAYPSATTTYTLTAIYPGNCNAQPSTEITIDVAAPALDLGLDISYCPSDGSVELGNSAPLGMEDYKWTPNYFLSNDDTRIVYADPPISTDYILTITDANGCKASDTINVAPSNPTPIAGADVSICAGESILLGSASNTGNITWYPSGGSLSCSTCPITLFSATQAGIYTVEIEQEIGGCFSYAEVNISVSSVQLPTFSATTICQDACITIGVPASFGIEYEWFPSTGLSHPNSSITTSCPNTTTTYTLVATNSLSGCTTSTQVPVFVSDIPAPSLSIPPLELCLGGQPLSFAPIFAPDDGDYSFNWSPPTGLSSTSSKSPSVLPMSIGSTTYQLEIVDDVTGCSNLALGTATTINCNVFLFGNVFYDLNGLSDNIVNGPPIAYIGSNRLYVNLILPGVFTVQNTTEVDPSGAYSFPVSPNTSYLLQLSTMPGIIGTTMPTTMLHGNWLNMGENLGAGPGSDGGNDGLLQVNVASSNVYNANFGVADFNILPIELLSFDVLALDDFRAKLLWSTASEINNDYFEIWRADNAINWQKLDIVYGAGNSSEISKYKWIDDLPLQGHNYYRLRQVDYDGQYSFSPIRMVTFNMPNLATNVFPNPFSGWLKVDGMPSNQIINAVIYDETGRLIKAYRPLTSNLISTANFPTGKYILLLQNESKAEQQVFKLIKF